MLQCDNPTHPHDSRSVTYSHTTNKIQSFHGVSDYPMCESGCMSPRRSPSLQSWKISRLPISPSFVPSAARPEQSEHVTLQMRRQPSENGAPPLSPFRSVRRMKKPFDLMLPASPRSSTDKDASLSPTRSRERTLRPWRSDQDIAATRLETARLPPSPPLSASPVSNPFRSSTYFLPKGEPDAADGKEPVRESECNPESRPCDFWPPPKLEGIVEDGNSSKEVINVPMTHSYFDGYHGSDESYSSPESFYAEGSSATASPLTDKYGDRGYPGSPPLSARDDTISSEGSWIPNNLSYFETWLQGVPAETVDLRDDDSRNGMANRRKFQIVQKFPSPFEVSGEPVTFAIASKTKPKLVDISPKLSPSMSYEDANQSPKNRLPCTPTQYQQEISAFSPDTQNEEGDSDHGFHSSCSSREYDKGDEYADTPSMHSHSMSSTAVCEQSVWSRDSHCQRFSPAKPDFTRTIVPPLKPQPSPGRESLFEREQLEKWWDHEWTLDQLELSVMDFPSNMLRLTSPAIMFLRQSNEQALLRPYRQIFPGVSENLLDSLCAGLIALNYVVFISSTKKSPGLPSGPSYCDFGIIPDKALSTLGIHVPRVSPTHIRDRVFGSRSAELRKNLDSIVDYLLFAIHGRSDETLKSAMLVLAETLETKP